MQRSVGLVVGLELELVAELVAGPGVVGTVDTHPVDALEAKG